jgi:hypothetical protein
MDEQRVPNLEEMNEQGAERFRTELVSNLTAERLYEISHEDYTMEMPQSGEVVRLSFRISHSAARQAIIVRMSTGRSAKANAVAATGSPSRHMIMKRAAMVAAHRETTRANRRLTLPPYPLHALDLVVAAQHDHACSQP